MKPKTRYLKEKDAFGNHKTEQDIIFNYEKAYYKAEQKIKDLEKDNKAKDNEIKKQKIETRIKELYKELELSSLKHKEWKEIEIRINELEKLLLP